MDYNKFRELMDRHREEIFELLGDAEKTALKHICEGAFKEKYVVEPNTNRCGWSNFYIEQYKSPLDMIDANELVRVCVDCGIFIYDYSDSHGRKFYEINPAWHSLLFYKFDLQRFLIQKTNRSL